MSAALIEAIGQDSMMELLLLVELAWVDEGNSSDMVGSEAVFGGPSSSFVDTVPSSPTVRVGRPSGGGRPPGKGTGTIGTRKRPLKPDVQAGGVDVILEGKDTVLAGHDLHAPAVSEGLQYHTGSVVAVPFNVCVTTVFVVKPENEE